MSYDNGYTEDERRYSEAVLDAAKACGVEYFDMAAELEKEFLEYGYEKTLEKYLLPISTVKKLREEAGICNPLPIVDDNVHYNYRGAEMICRKLIEQMAKSNSGQISQMACGEVKTVFAGAWDASR